MREEIQRHEQIKMQLRVGGSSLAKVARELGVQTSTVASVSRGRWRSRRIEAAIGAALGISPEQLWPERYVPAASLSASTNQGRLAMS